MLRDRRLLGVLRLLLGLSFVALLALQLRVLPAVHDDWLRGAPERAVSGWLLPASVVGLLCVQVVVVGTWRLLATLAQERVEDADVHLWLDVVAGAVVAAWLVLLAVFASVLASGEPAGASSAVLLLLLVVGAVGCLLVVVLRALLRRALLRVELPAGA